MGTGIDTNSAATLRELEAETEMTMLTGIDMRFSVVISLGGEIAAEDAACNGTRVLFDRHTASWVPEKDVLWSFSLWLVVIVSVCMWRTWRPWWKQRRPWRLR